MATDTKGMTPLAATFARCKPARTTLQATCQCVEALQDHRGLLTERWITADGLSLILWATPDWWDLFEPTPAGGSLKATLARIHQLAPEPSKGNTPPAPSSTRKTPELALND